MNSGRFAIIIFLVPVLLAARTALAGGATLYAAPDYAVHAIGDTFDVHIFADSGGQAINAAEADLTFNSQALSVVGLSTRDSILDSWPTPPHFSNTYGTIGFSGVANQDFNGAQGLLLTITFKALRNMESSAHFVSGAILAADSVESNIVTTMQSGVYDIGPTKVSGQTAGAAAAGGASYSGPSADTGIGSNASSEGAGDPSVPAPTLLDYQNQVSAGDRIIVQGTAPANATVSVWFQEGSDKPSRTDMSANPDGSFTYVSDTVAQQGIYHVWAFTIGDAGIQSPSSNKVTIAAISSGTASAAQFAVSLSSNIVPLFALLVFAGLGTGYLLHRHKVEKFRIEHGRQFDS